MSTLVVVDFGFYSAFDMSRYLMATWKERWWDSGSGTGFGILHKK